MQHTHFTHALHTCRDLKLDNTLLDDSQPPVLKICDFGFAKDWTESANMYTHIGYCTYPGQWIDLYTIIKEQAHLRMQS